MRAILISILLISAISIGFAEEIINLTNASSTGTTVELPWNPDSRVCVFLREWVLKGVFMVITLVFLLGVAAISGAAFPQWREKGGMMILGALGAVLLYLIGMPALKFLTQTSFCGL